MVKMLEHPSETFYIQVFVEKSPFRGKLLKLPLNILIMQEEGRGAYETF